MNDIDHIQSHDHFAAGYDEQVKTYHSYGHDVLFGMCYGYISAPGLLLDLGIGTGLSSHNFAKAGLSVIGLDGSAEMLNECRKKAFAKALQQYNLQDVPYPFQDGDFSFVICCGVLHFFGDLQPILQDAARLLRNAGILAFTIASPQKHDLTEDTPQHADFIRVPTAWGVPIYKHANHYINKLAKELNFSILKEQKVLTDSGDPEQPDLLFKTIVMQKTKV